MSDAAKPPAPEESQKTPAPSPALAAPAANVEEKVILVVDDKGTTRNILGHNLRNAGYRVVEAESGIVALNIAMNDRVDMVILDVMMPKLDGFAVCEKLRKNEKTAKVPIVMCTAKGFKEDVVHAMQVGANDYIVKPFTKATVLDKVKRFVGEPSRPQVVPKVTVVKPPIAKPGEKREPEKAEPGAQTPMPVKPGDTKKLAVKTPPAPPKPPPPAEAAPPAGGTETPKQ